MNQIIKGKQRTKYGRNGIEAKQVPK